MGADPLELFCALLGTNVVSVTAHTRQFMNDVVLRHRALEKRLR